MKRYMMSLTLALVLGGCAPSIWGERGPCNFCVTGPPPSDPLGTVLDGSIYRRATSTPTHAPDVDLTLPVYVHRAPSVDRR